MTSNILFLTFLCAAIAVYLRWGFINLPHEKGQMLASIPVRKRETGEWEGVNITYYGLLTANSLVFSMAACLALLVAAGMDISLFFPLAAGILGVAIPSSKIVARVVEKKKETFTVGGASFIATLSAPFAVWLVNMASGAMGGGRLEYAQALSALAVAFILGESVGRLACVSFGCCYGKPLAENHPLLRRFFEGRAFVFTGATRKIAYSGAMSGVEVLPIQAVTAVVYAFFGVAGLAMFLASQFVMAFVTASIAAHLWRAVSEIFRADYRGEGKISAYQWMGITASVYTLAVASALPTAPAGGVTIVDGLLALWNPWIIVFFLGVWLSYFIYMGTSKVTGCSITYFVNHERV